MVYKALGKIMVELPTTHGITKTGKDWEKKEYVMETNERYQSKMRFSLYSWDGPIDNPPKVGDKIEVTFSVEAREVKGVWYNEVKACRIEYSE